MVENEFWMNSNPSTLKLNQQILIFEQTYKYSTISDFIVHCRICISNCSEFVITLNFRNKECSWKWQKFVNSPNLKRFYCFWCEIIKYIIWRIFYQPSNKKSDLLAFDYKCHRLYLYDKLKLLQFTTHTVSTTFHSTQFRFLI